MTRELEEGLAGLPDVEDTDAVGVLGESCEEMGVMRGCLGLSAISA